MYQFPLIVFFITEIYVKGVVSLENTTVYNLFFTLNLQMCLFTNCSIVSINFDYFSDNGITLPAIANSMMIPLHLSIVSHDTQMTRTMTL